MGKKAPKAPDPTATAKAEAEANRVSQYLPNGTSMVYGKMNNGVWTPDANNAAIKINESDYDKQLRGIGENTTMQLANMLSGNISNIPGYGTIPNVNDFSNDARRVEDETFNRARGLINRDYGETQTKYRDVLANQGIPMGSEAYDSEFSRLERGHNDAINQAAQDAVLAGRQEQQRLFSNAMSTSGAQNAQRSAMLQELASILGGQAFTPQGAGFFGNVPQIDVMGQANRNYQNQMAGYNSNMNATGGLLGALGSAAIGKWI